MTPHFSRSLADLVLLAHLSYVAFVVLGELLILLGGLAGWSWVHNRSFRMTHLTMIGIVVVEALLKITCPLTTLENWLRIRAGQAAYPGDWIASWLHDLLFINAPGWMFTVAYASFGVIVLLSCWWVPLSPRRRISPVQ